VHAVCANDVLQQEETPLGGYPAIQDCLACLDCFLGFEFVITRPDQQLTTLSSG